MKAIKKRWLFGVFSAFLIVFALVGPASVSFGKGSVEGGRLKEVVYDTASGAAKGGGAMQSSSIVFLAGVRNAYAGQGIASEVFHGYGEAPTEPSLASALGGSLLKQSSPLTIATAENIRIYTIEYIVKPGDVPSIIAASFGITANTLLWANNLSDGEVIKPGDKLVILPVSGVKYKVKAGDTISNIAVNYKGEIDKIIAFNDLDVSASIVVGDYIIIPDGEMPRSTYRGNLATYAPYLQNLDSYFIHPTAGVGYRSRGTHPHNAVDIAASCWTPIYAAAAGTVAISDGYGWNGGYGKYIKIDHGDGVGTLYSHNIQNEISAGQYAQQGQLIAYMGSTGRSTGCHVHWEVYGALNPLR
ncbi:MAG: peptidoglycan DD-metalloendopeptidase family protein [Candidatus Spechtbacterales bacterium]